MNGIATEHVVFCAERGDSPRDVIESVGLEWPAWKKPLWGDAVYAVQVARARLLRAELRAVEAETRAMGVTP